MSATDRPRLGTSREWTPSRSSRSSTMLRSRRKSCATTACAHVVELPRHRIDRALQHRVAQGDEHDDMAVGHPLHALDQQLGGDGVDEIGEQDDQRAPQPRIELGQARVKLVSSSW